MLKADYTCPRCGESVSVKSISTNFGHFPKPSCSTCKKLSGTKQPMVLGDIVHQDAHDKVIDKSKRQKKPKKND